MILSDNNKGFPKSLLICTPSNIAIDEITSRIVKKGLINDICEYTLNKRSYKVPRVVRMGVFNYNIDEDVKKVTLDQLVDQRIGQTTSKDIGKLSNKIFIIDSAIKAVENDVKSLFENVSSIITKEEMELLTKMQRHEKINWLTNQKKLYESRIMIARSEKDSQGNIRSLLEMQIIQEADIVCTTLSSSGSELLEVVNKKFDYLIVDESCQCTELSCLIPFKHDIGRVVLIGDHMQLPPTIFSNDPKYTISLFERMVKCRVSPMLMTIQYRMEPEIREFASHQFYHGKIIDDDSICSRKMPSSISNILSHFNKMCFCDLQYSCEKKDGSSTINMNEVNTIVNLLESLDHLLLGNTEFYSSLGIISPYKKQVTALRAQLSNPKYAAIEISTVDGFQVYILHQGKEKNIIIISCVRTNTKTIGFLEDTRRLNVAVTRAKYCLWVIGNSKSLIINSFWRNLIEYCGKKGCYYNLKNDSDIQAMNKYGKSSPPLIDFTNSSLEKPNILNKTLEKDTKESIKKRKRPDTTHPTSETPPVSKRRIKKCQKAKKEGILDIIAGINC